MLRQVEHTSWLAATAGQRPGGAAFARAQWDWALSVVHSRTFGAPGPFGGVGTRMLVPLVDMLNHAGDYLTSAPGAADPAVQAFENVRWDLAPPAGPDGEWRMQVAATRDVPAGGELLLSYGGWGAPWQQPCGRRQAGGAAGRMSRAAPGTCIGDLRPDPPRSARRAPHPHPTPHASLLLFCRRAQQ